MTRRILPQRRPAETFNLRFWNQQFTVTSGQYPDGAPGELFIDGGKTGHGAEVETICHAVTRSENGEAASILGAIVDKTAVLAVDAAKMGGTR